MISEREAVAGPEVELQTEGIDRTRRVRRGEMLLLAGATLALSAVMFGFGLWGSGGNLAAPLDDTFIHLQYARQLVAGHPYEYNTGDPPSSGDSAFIYPFMLAPAFMVGLDGMRALLWADLLGVLAHVALVLMVYSLGYRLGGRVLALFAAWFVVLDGSLNWTFLTGMETGLYTAGLVAFFWVLARDEGQDRLWPLALVGSFLALIRTEGHVLASLACVLLLVYLWRTRGFSPRYLWLLVPAVVGLLPYAVNVAITGHWQYNTAAGKSIWYVPYAPLLENLANTVGYGLQAIKNFYLGLEVGRSPFTLMALPVAIAGAAVALRDARYRVLHVLMLVTLVGGFGLALLLPPLHFNRYFQPYNPLFWLYFSIGLVALATLVVRSVGTLRDSRAAYAWVWVAAAVLVLPQFFAYFFAFADSNRDIYYQQMAFSEWVRRYTPPDARIAVNDTGAHKYLSDRYVIDMIGLTYNDLRGSYFGGWGSVFDVLARLPEDRRPTHMLVHPNVFVNGLDESVSQSLLQPLYSITIRNPAISAGPVETLYTFDWGYAALDPAPTRLLSQGQQPLDTLNVGDLPDEAAHGYDTEARQPTTTDPKSIVTTTSYEDGGLSLSDSGRRHSGWEEFRVRSVPGKPLVLVSRTRLNPDTGQRLLVLANGRELDLWEVENERGPLWQEYEYTIPAEHVTSDTTTIRLDSTFDPGGPGFASYRYWAFAGE
jgi:hypothetical protein